MRIELTLLRRAQDGGEDLLGLSALRRAIAATDFSAHDCWTEGLFGAPVECRAYCYAEPQLLRPRSVGHREGSSLRITERAISDAISVSVALKRPERSLGGITDSRASSFTDGSARV